MRILLVEDEDRLADSVARGLRQAAHAVDIARRCYEARSRIATEPYDAILLDVLLPDGSGLDLLEEIRAHGNRVPVLLLTARDTIADRVRGLDGGADDYLVKPVALDELLARLRAVARRGEALRPARLVVGDLTIDPGARTAERAGRLLDLTTTEFSLLAYLAEQAGQVRGRAQISAHVWDHDYDPMSNIIDVYIARLRRKLDLPGAPALLHTVRGAGYVLDPSRAGGD